MSKILESEFRKELYKNLVEAGYDKTEAQRIVGTKYHCALKENIIEMLADVNNKIQEEKYNEITLNPENINNTIEELKKIQEVLK